MIALDACGLDDSVERLKIFRCEEYGRPKASYVFGKM